RQMLERWRTDAEHYARLERNLAEFRELPEGNKERLRQLEQDLRGDTTIALRLRPVLEAYLSWLSRLPESDRQKIRLAADQDERLSLIQQLRERDWIAQLPRQLREKVEAATDSANRATLIADLRREDLAFRKEWESALRRPEVFESKTVQLLFLADLPQQ